MECNCKYYKNSRCHYWTSLGRKIDGLSIPSWCPSHDKNSGNMSDSNDKEQFIKKDGK